LTPEYLLRVQRQVVAQHARGLLGGDLGHDGNVIEDRGDVVEQGEQAGGHGGSGGGAGRQFSHPAAAPCQSGEGVA